MNISLTPELNDLIKNKVKSGLYISASEVIREALRLLKSRDEFHREKIIALKQDIRKGTSSLDAGLGVEMTDTLFNSIKEQGRQKLTAGKNKQ
jgi:antitoxin ParD1/3/4